ncbi:MAG: NAD(P)H-binding protein, partial [Nostocaceae cyanobacterium]|nr:NAD(P)H-binding protein [Nostocaceae cyanobacterium]
MTETILVTSATSNVGTPLVKQLAEQGVNVRAAVRAIAKAQALKFPGVELVEMDLDKPETIPPAFAGVDKVFLTTPITENMVETEAMCL